MEKALGIKQVSSLLEERYYMSKNTLEIENNFSTF